MLSFLPWKVQCLHHFISSPRETVDVKTIQCSHSRITVPMQWTKRLSCVWYRRKAIGEQGIENRSPKAMSNHPNHCLRSHLSGLSYCSSSNLSRWAKSTRLFSCSWFRSCCCLQHCGIALCQIHGWCFPARGLMQWSARLWPRPQRSWQSGWGST